ncbi:MAG: sugar ABC transporter permease, partial [Rhodobacteraceae bacterium]|nr:sugar ABC transporter permease [Paracoccaceae bacterium]
MPTVLFLLVLAMAPTLYAVSVSFTDRTLFDPASRWVGFANYTKLFEDRRFLNAAFVSLKWEAVTV